MNFLWPAYERMMSFRYLRAKRSEGFVSLITAFSFVGIALGVATLIVVMAVMNGFRTQITSKILGVSGHMMVSGLSRQLTDYEALSGNISSVEGIQSAASVIDAQAMIVGEFGTVGALIKGMTPKDLAKRPVIADHILEGSLHDLSREDGIMLGLPLALRLGVRVGDSLRLYSPQTRNTAMGAIPKMKSFHVVAIYQSGMYEFDNNLAYIPLSIAQRLFDYKNAVSTIEVTTENPDLVSIYSQRIYEKIGYDYRVNNWQDMNASLFNALKVERTVMFIILTMIVFIAAFNIISSLIMLVKDKGTDIAILRTMGATRAAIMRIFFVTGASIGLGGTALGCALGVGVAANITRLHQWLEATFETRLFDPVIYFLSELPSDIQINDVIWAAMVGIIFSFLATLYPAWRASKQDPADALRYE